MDPEKLAELLASLLGDRLGELIMYLRLIEQDRQRNERGPELCRLPRR